MVINMQRKPLENWWGGRPEHGWNNNIKTYKISSWYSNQRYKTAMRVWSGENRVELKQKLGKQRRRSGRTEAGTTFR
jgi:hypothetical protein